MDGILNGLNAAQRAAVTSDASVLQVLAPPGSGKTKTLTARVAYLIAHRQLKPWNIIVCTFTVKAAKEMQERIRAFVGEELEKKLKVGTFHSIAIRFLRRYYASIGLDERFGVADSNDSLAIFKRIVSQNQFSLEPRAARNRVSSNKSKGIDAEQFALSAKKGNAEQQEFVEIFRLYQTQLEQCGLLDYDDILLRCTELLRKHPECVANVEAVLVDEFQDTNGVQFELMTLFAQKRSVITIVGDPDQSIYGWRSAEIKNLGRMKERWPDTMTVNLEENYRSSGAILHAAQKLIDQDESRPAKKLQATHTLGQRPVLRKLPAAKSEAEWLVSEIKRMKALTGDMLGLDDFAILVRSAALSRAVETALGNASLAYRMIGGKRFYDRAEIRLVVDYLRVINQPGNNEAVVSVINLPSRKVGDKTVEALLKEAQEKGVPLWRLVMDVAQGRAKVNTKISSQAQQGIGQFVNVILSGQSKHGNNPGNLVDLVNTVVAKINMQKWLKSKYPEDHETRWANVEELIAQAIGFPSQAQQPPGPEEGDLPDDAGSPLANFLSSAALSGGADDKDCEDGEQQQHVTISTIHAAKGLEWPVVFIPACYDGSIPHSRAEDTDEERRILYVAMTRAQALLNLSCPTRNTSGEETTMSSFLTQPGVSNYFEEHGPSISHGHVQGLAKTLRRVCPTAAEVTQASVKLENDEDNYWPLNGEMPYPELAKCDAIEASGNGSGSTRPAAWVNTTTSMDSFDAGTYPQPGFASVKDKYADIMKEREAAERSKLDRRAKEKGRIDADQAPKGRKRQIQGQGSLASFFAKKSRPDDLAGQASVSAPSVASGFRSAVEPLRDISNMRVEDRSDELPTKPFVPPHKPRTAPLANARVPKSHAPEPLREQKDTYVFLSSDPPQPEDQEPEPECQLATGTSQASTAVISSFKPVSTFHSTTMQSIGPKRKTLGMGRGFVPWSARGGKR